MSFFGEINQLYQYRKMTGYDREVFDMFMNLLENHVTDSTMRVRDYSDMMCMNRGTLFLHVTRVAGLSPMKVITDVRMNLAKHLLALTRLNVGEIGSMVGLEDVPHFCFLFHRHNDLTPSRFRNLWQSGELDTADESLLVYELPLADGTSVKLDLKKLAQTRWNCALAEKHYLPFDDFPWL